MVGFLKQTMWDLVLLTYVQPMIWLLQQIERVWPGVAAMSPERSEAFGRAFQLGYTIVWSWAVFAIAGSVVA